MPKPFLVFTVGALAFAAAPAARIDAAGPSTPSARTTAPAAPATHFGTSGLPCDFERNLGQTAPEVDYVARCRGYVAFLTRGDAVIRTGAEALRLRVKGGHAAEPSASQPRPGTSHYFIGSDSSKGVTGVPHTGEVAYRGVLPGVDLVYRTGGRELAFDVHVAAGTDAASVSFAVDGAAWLGPDASGDLAIGLPSGGTARLTAPRAWQEDGASRRPVTVAFAQGSRADEFGFAVGPRDPSLPLVIDPGLSVSTYLGGASTEQVTSVRTSAAGGVYVCGSTNSLDFPVSVGAFQTTKGELSTAASDGFVMRLDSTGTQLAWCTYLGGSSSDTAFDVAIGIAGDVYVGGSTNSANFPRQNAYQTTPASGFVAKLSSSGASLTWSTYFTYFTQKLGLDTSENVRCYCTSPSRLFAFDSTGTTLLLSVPVDGFSPPNFTFTSYTVLQTGEAWIGGSLTNNQINLSMPGAFQGSYGGAQDGWFVKVNASGTEVYRSYLGGTGNDRITSMCTDTTGNLYLCGWTTLAAFPVVNPAQISKGTGQCGFVMKLNAAASAATFSTFLGSDNDVTPSAIAVNGSGEVFVAGWVTGSSFPTQDAYQSAYGGGPADAILAEYDTQGVLLRSTFLGGTGNDSAAAITVSATGRPLVVGNTQSSGFPTTCGISSSLKGTSDVFLAGVTTSPPFVLDPAAQFLPSGTISRSYSQQLAVTGGAPQLIFVLDSGAVPPGLTLTSSGVLEGTPTSAANAVMFVKVRDGAGQCMVKEFRVIVNAAPVVPASTLPPWTAMRPYDVLIPRTDGTPPFAWELASGSAPPGLSVTAAGALAGMPTAPGTFSFGARVTDANGAVAEGTLTMTVNAVPAVTTAALGDWTVGRPYTQPFAVTDGTPPFAWSVTGGSLPANAALDPVTGSLNSTALLAEGDATFTVVATDAAGAIAAKDFTLHVNATPSIVVSRLPFAAAGRPYAVPIETADGTPPFTWSVRNGSFGPGFTGIDAEGRVVGTAGAEGTSAATVRLVDAAGASAEASLSVTVVPGVDIATGKGSSDFAVTPILSGKDVTRYVELLAGSTLDLKAKVTRANLFAIDLQLLDSTETPLDLAPFKKSKDPVVSVRKFPVPRTGRYLVVVTQLPGFTGNVSLEVSASASAKRSGTGRIDPAGTIVSVRIAAQPGSQLVLATSAARKSGAVPSIVSLLDPQGAEILDPADVRSSKKGAVLQTSHPLAGGDYVAIIAADGGVAGDVKWALSLKSPKGYAFSLPALPVSGE